MRLKMVTLGASGLTVTELGFGTLTMSPIQADMLPDAGGVLIRQALEQGVTFLDTAQGYRAYAHVAAGIRDWPRGQIVIATKTHAHTAEEMQQAFDQACTEMGIDYIDLFHLHLIRSAEDFTSRAPALARLQELKADGRVKAIGISAHTIAPFRAVIGDERIDVCFPAFNRGGFGINDGTVDEMIPVLEELHAEGKGIYAMKPLGGGHLAADFEAALDYVRGFGFMDAVCVGMKHADELALNIRYFSGRPVTEEMKARVRAVPRRLLINGLCKACGRCVEVCEQGALHIGDGRAEVDAGRCIFCGYCAPECPQFAIRVI